MGTAWTVDTAWIIPLLAASLLVLVMFRALGARRRRKLRAEYQRMLERSLADGVLTPEELIQLEAVRAKGALTPEEVRLAALAIYRSALHEAAIDARLTPDEDAALRQLQDQLGLTEQDLGADFTRLSRLRMLARIAAGNMPVVPPPVALLPGETCHWVVQCTLAERIPVPQSARRSLASADFNVEAANPFVTQGSLDPLRPAPDVLPSDVGALIVTSRRTLFHGAKRTVSVPHARVERLRLYVDGVRLDEITRTARRYFLVDDAELTCAIMLQAARIRRAEIRPARSHRTA